MVILFHDRFCVISINKASMQLVPTCWIMTAKQFFANTTSIKFWRLLRRADLIIRFHWLSVLKSFVNFIFYRSSNINLSLDLNLLRSTINHAELPTLSLDVPQQQYHQFNAWMPGRKQVGYQHVSLDSHPNYPYLHLILTILFHPFSA